MCGTDENPPRTLSVPVGEPDVAKSVFENSDSRPPRSLTSDYIGQNVRRGCDFAVGKLFSRPRRSTQAICRWPLTPKEREAYDAVLDDISYREVVQCFTVLHQGGRDGVGGTDAATACYDRVARRRPSPSAGGLDGVHGKGAGGDGGWVYGFVVGDGDGWGERHGVAVGGGSEHRVARRRPSGEYVSKTF